MRAIKKINGLIIFLLLAVLSNAQIKSEDSWEVAKQTIPRMPDLERNTTAFVNTFINGDIRDRYDGVKRNPFNEAEFGNHYARSMMAWGAVLAITGFHYSAVDQSMKFNPADGTHFWSNGYQYGTINLSEESRAKKVSITVLNGSLNLRSFTLRGFGRIDFGPSKKFNQNETLTFLVEKD